MLVYADRHAAPESDAHGAAELGVAMEGVTMAESPTAPFGIKLLCLVQAFGLFVSFVAAARLGTELERGGDVMFAAVTAWAVVGAAVVYGLWRLRGWGWRLALGYFGVGILVNLLAPLAWRVQPAAVGSTLLYQLLAFGYVAASADAFR